MLYKTKLDLIVLVFFTLHKDRYRAIVFFSLVNGSNGLLIQKSDPNRKVTSYYEGKFHKEHFKHLCLLRSMEKSLNFNHIYTCQNNKKKWERLLKKYGIGHSINNKY